MIAQPIETAPKDGTRLLLYCPWKKGPQWYAGRWHESQTTEFGKVVRDFKKWIYDGDLYYSAPDPTHWMPMPEDPT